MSEFAMPKPVLKDRALYLGDNGRCLCGRCSGMSARFTGRDISGQKVTRVTAALAMEYRALGDGDLGCECCGFVAVVKGRGVR
jgi:hypothetical protein